MAAYNDASGVCIDGASPVLLAAGAARHAAKLRKGDRVAASGGATAEVTCVVRTRCPRGRAVLVEIPGGARLTPHHPVSINGEWRFPKDVAAARESACEAVYSFVLRGAPDLLVGGTPCAALAHGMEDGAARHPYFGSPQVLEDLALLPGYEVGFVDLPPGCAIRDPATGLVCGLRAESQKHGGA